MKKTALIIGSGLGGLSTALRLNKLGYNVTIIEKHHTAGGRLNILKKDGFTFDIGPSFFSMTYEFKEFEKDIETKLPFEFISLDPLYSVNITGGSKTYSIYKDLNKLAKEFENIEPDFENKMKLFLKSAETLFNDTYTKVVKQNYNSIFDFLSHLKNVPIKHGPKVLKSVWSELNKYFTSQEVKQIFSLVAFFLGATPFDTPAIYTLLNYTEMVHDGYHNVKGGMYKIVEAMVTVAKEKGIEIIYNTEIKKAITNNNKLDGFIDQNNKEWKADIYVCNADAAAFRGSIFNRPKYTSKKLDKLKWTLAPLTIYLGIKGKMKNIEHHNYYLGNNFKDYASKIFKNNITLEKAYYYVNVLSKLNPESAPEGCESLFILCPVPDLRYKPDWNDRDKIVDGIIADLSERTGFNIADNIITKTVYTPQTWEKMFNLYRGSGLGLAHDFKQIGGFRPKNFDEEYNNLYYVGASTVPGTGLPMVVISSKLVTERIIKDHGFIS